MTQYLNAKDLLKNTESAVVVFTHGDYLQIDPNGSGQSGIWVVNPDNLDYVDSIIIYLRLPNSNINRLLKGTYLRCSPAGVPRRYYLHFSELKEIGTTPSNWIQFGNGGQNPVCIIG